MHAVILKAKSQLCSKFDDTIMIVIRVKIYANL